MGFARMLATLIFILALPVALVTSNIRLLLNAPPVYAYAFDRYNATDTTGLSRADLDSTAAGLRRYFNNGEKTFYQTVTLDGLQVSVYNARETLHMQKVKRLVTMVDWAQEATLVYVLAYVVAFFVWSRDGSIRQLATQTLASLSFGAAIVAGIGIYAALGFEAFWTRFHLIFFPHGGWQFDPATDRLIQMFPDPFWRDMVAVLIVMSALEALLIGAAAAVYLLGSRGERRHLAGSIDVKTHTTQAA